MVRLKGGASAGLRNAYRPPRGCATADGKGTDQVRARARIMKVSKA